MSYGVVPSAALSLALPLVYRPLYVEAGVYENRTSLTMPSREDEGDITTVSSATYAFAVVGAELEISRVFARVGPRLKMPIASENYSDLETVTLGVVGEVGGRVARISNRQVSAALRYHRDVTPPFRFSSITYRFPTIEARIEVGL